MQPALDSMSSDVELLGNLYRAHHSWLYAWLCRRLNNQQDAADIAQEAFLRLLKKNHAYEYSQPRALLTTIAKNISYDWWQKRQIEQAYLEALQHAEPHYQPSAEDESIALQTLLELNQVLRALTARQQQVFLLYQLEDYSYADIALKLQVSIITAKRDMQQALMACLSIMQLD
jgi:RNA polymerase sigma factor (sigma-70 family)